MEHTAQKVVNITSLKQAIWIKSRMQGISRSKTSSERREIFWTQVIAKVEGCKMGEILAEYQQGSHLSPLEVSKLYPQGHVWMRRETTSRALTSESAEDTRLIAAFSAPAGKETILAHLVRASAILPIKGTNKDSKDEGDTQTAYLLSDFTSRLIHNKVTELQLYLGLEDIIEKEEFFPSYAKLHKAIFGKAEAKAS